MGMHQSTQGCTVWMIIAAAEILQRVVRSSVLALPSLHNWLQARKVDLGPTCGGT